MDRRRLARTSGAWAAGAALGGCGGGSGSEPRWVLEQLTGGSPFPGVNGLAVDPQGRLVVMDAGRRRTVLIDPATDTQPEAVDIVLPVGLSSPAGPPRCIPDGVAAGSDGAVDRRVKR